MKVSAQRPSHLFAIMLHSRHPASMTQTPSIPTTTNTGAHAPALHWILQLVCRIATLSTSCCTAPRLHRFAKITMAANNQRTIAPQTSMSSHAQMMTAINYPSMNSTSFEQERLSPSSKHDSSPVATPVSSFQSASRHTAEDSSPNNHSSSSACRRLVIPMRFRTNKSHRCTH